MARSGGLPLRGLKTKRSAADSCNGSLLSGVKVLLRGNKRVKEVEVVWMMISAG